MATPNDAVPDFSYITRPVYSPAVPQSLIDNLNKPNAESKSWSKIAESDVSVKDAVEVRLVEEAGHPACGQHGLFAIRDIAPSALILFYLGRVHLNDETDTDAASDYDLSFDRELGLSIDGQTMGNEARFMNDYRGVADGPNAEFRDCWVRLEDTDRSAKGARAWERRIGIFALSEGKAKRNKGIKRGEEILVNYGRTFWSERKAA